MDDNPVLELSEITEPPSGDVLKFDSTLIEPWSSHKRMAASDDV
jgi:hypothetical protein